jgi:hypothetical protein
MPVDAYAVEDIGAPTVAGWRTIFGHPQGDG